MIPQPYAAEIGDEKPNIVEFEPIPEPAHIPSEPVVVPEPEPVPA